VKNCGRERERERERERYRMNVVRYGEFNVFAGEIADDDWLTVAGEEVHCEHISV